MGVLWLQGLDEECFSVSIRPECYVDEDLLRWRTYHLEVDHSIMSKENFKKDLSLPNSFISITLPRPCTPLIKFLNPPLSHIINSYRRSQSDGSKLSFVTINDQGTGILSVNSGTWSIRNKHFTTISVIDRKFQRHS